jgi:rubrerythrin
MPSVSIFDLGEGWIRRVEQILRESLEREMNAVRMCSDLLKDVQDDVVVDAFVREFVSEEQSHAEEVEKKLREPLLGS